MPIFEALKSNSLKFRRTEDDSDPQTDFNRSYSEYDYPNRYFIPYYMKVQTDGDLWFQYLTDYTSMVVELHDCDGLVSTLTNTNILVEDDFSYYQVNVSVSALSGYYKILISMEQDEGFPIAHYESNVFQVAASFPYTLLLGWYGSYANEIPIQWELNGDKYQELRIDAIMVSYKGGALSTQLRGTDGNLITVNYQTLYRETLETIELLPKHMVEKINVALGHDNFIVNDQIWNIDGTLETGERKGNSDTYGLSIDLELKDAYNNASYNELTGDLPIIPSTALQFDTGIALQFDTGIGLRFK